MHVAEKLCFYSHDFRIRSSTWAVNGRSAMGMRNLVKNLAIFLWCNIKCSSFWQWDWPSCDILFPVNNTFVISYVFFYSDQCHQTETATLGFIFYGESRNIWNEYWTAVSGNLFRLHVYKDEDASMNLWHPSIWTLTCILGDHFDIRYLHWKVHIKFH